MQGRMHQHDLNYFGQSIFTRSRIFLLFNNKNHSKLNKSILDFLKYNWKNVKNFNMTKHSWWHVWKIHGDIYCDLKQIYAWGETFLFHKCICLSYIYMIKLSGLRVNKISNICEIFFERKQNKVKKKKSNKIMPILTLYI